MNVKSTEQANGKAKIVVEIEKQEFEAALNKAYNKAKKDILVPGFRKGKAPRKVVEGMYGAKIFYEDAVNEIFPEIYGKAVIEQQLKAVGAPSISDMDETEEGAIILTVETELYPEVTLGQYKGVEVAKAEAAVSDEDVANELNRMAERNSRIETVERPIQEGDTVVLDFEGFDNGIAFEGGKGENYSLKIGSNQFVPGFEEALIGLTAGEEKDIDVTFPENYTPELAGKPVVFKCKIHEVKETIKPELDDEFAKDVSEFDTLDELKADIRAKQLKMRQDNLDRQFENDAVAAAAANMTAEIPACMFEDEINKQMDQFAYQLQMSGMSMDDYSKMIGGNTNALRESIRPMAETTVRSNVLLSAVVDAEGIEVSEEEMEAEYAKVAEQYQMEVDQVKAALNAETVKADLASRKAVKLIVDNAVATAVKEEAKEEE